MDTRETNRRNAKRRVLSKTGQGEKKMAMPTNTPAPEQRRGLPWWAVVLIVLGILMLGSCCIITVVGGLILNGPIMVPAEETEVAVIPTAASTEAPAPTEQPENLPTYQILVDDEIVGVPLDNGAVAITTGRILTGHDAPYSDAELAIIQSTPVTFQVTNDSSGMSVAFGYKVEDHSGGVIQYLGTDSLEITILDGELVIWPNYDLMVADVSNRIPDEIQNGNADFDSLAFHWISREFRGFVADSLITDRGVKILP